MHSVALLANLESIDFQELVITVTPLELGQTRHFICLAVTSIRTDARTSEMRPERSAGNVGCFNEGFDRYCNNAGNRFTVNVW
jgi:hypothetical protein